MSIPVFLSYSHKDDLFREELEAHLKILKRQKLIQGWSDRRIAPGSNWEEEINFNLKKAKIFILLISADFLASDYCYETETIFALEQHEKGAATVVPIIVRPCFWKIAHFKHLQVLPPEGKSILEWDNRDLAWSIVTERLYSLIEKINEDEKNKLLKTISENEVEENQANGTIAGAAAGAVVGTFNPLLGAVIGSLMVPPLNSKNPKNEEEEMTLMILNFLYTYREWYFSPLRIQKWGGQQKGFEKISTYDSKIIGKQLMELERKGIVKRTKSKKGNPIYKLNRYFDPYPYILSKLIKYDNP